MTCSFLFGNGNGELGIGQQGLGIVYPHLQEVLIKGHSGIFPEYPFKMVFTESRILGNALKGEVLREVLRNICASVAH